MFFPKLWICSAICRTTPCFTRSHIKLCMVALLFAHLPQVNAAPPLGKTNPFEMDHFTSHNFFQWRDCPPKPLHSTKKAGLYFKGAQCFVGL